MILDLVPSLKLTAVRTWKWMVFSTRNAFPDSQTRTLDLLFMGSLDLFWKELSGWKWPSQVAQKDQQKSGNLWGKTSAFSGLLGWPFFHKSKHDEQFGSQQRWRGWFAPSSCLVGTRTYFPPKRKALALGWCSPFLVAVTTKGWVLGAFFFWIWTPKYQLMLFLSKPTLLLF